MDVGIEPRISDPTMITRETVVIEKKPNAIYAFLQTYKTPILIVAALIIGALIMLWFIYPRSNDATPTAQPAKNTVKEPPAPPRESMASRDPPEERPAAAPAVLAPMMTQANQRRAVLERSRAKDKKAKETVTILSLMTPAETVIEIPPIVGGTQAVPPTTTPPKEPDVVINIDDSEDESSDSGESSECEPE